MSRGEANQPIPNRIARAGRMSTQMEIVISSGLFIFDQILWNGSAEVFGEVGVVRDATPAVVFIPMGGAQQAALHQVLPHPLSSLPLDIAQKIHFNGDNLEHHLSIPQVALLDMTNHPNPAAFVNMTIDQ